MMKLIIAIVFGWLISLAAGDKNLSKKEIAERAARKEVGLFLAPVRAADTVNDMYRIVKNAAKNKQSTSAGIVANIKRPYQSLDGHWFPTRYERNQWDVGVPCAWKKSNGLCGGY